ncbi:unnamed protein product [Gordionus sp. m RMFG-2023]
MIIKDIYRIILKNSKKLNNNSTPKLITNYIRKLIDNNEVTASRYCRDKNKDLCAKYYSSKEVTVEQAAKRMGFELPKSK